MILKEYFELINDLTPVGSLIVDREGVILDCNSAARHIFSDAELKGKNISNLIKGIAPKRHAELVKEFIDSDRKVLSMKSRDPVETVSGCYVRVSLFQGDKVTCLAVFENVTDMVETSRAMELSYERQKLLLNSLTDANYDYVFRDGKIFISDKLKALLGFSSDELPDNFESFALWDDRIHPEDRKKVQARREAYLSKPRNGKTFEVRYRVRDKHDNYMRIEAKGLGFWDEGGQLISYTGVIYDLTDTIQELKKLHDSQINTERFLAVQQRLFKQLRLAGFIGLCAVGWFAVTTKISFEMSDNNHPIFGIQSRDTEAIASLIQYVPTAVMTLSALWVSGGGKKIKDVLGKGENEEENPPE